MRAIAMYLPQFHRIPENDKWWGEGFTEWTAVKNARPLYDGHEQPRVPLNDNYYDLLDKKTMEWQAELMHRYGIDGVAIYHYWFKDGRKLLEKPAENLLEWKDIDMPFCFCWANETWARTWSAVKQRSVNTWADAFEPDEAVDQNDDSSGILVEQKYGERSDWTSHFEYLIPFFRDKRYIRIDNKPVFMIYKASEIDCLKEMVSCWRDIAVKSGFEGIYIIGSGLDKNIAECVDAINYRAPADLAEIYRKHAKGLYKTGYVPCREVWNLILNKTPVYDIPSYFSGIVGYDASPRRGRNGIIFERGTAEEFEQNLFELFLKNRVYNKEVTFINAWNEWGESMYLEPDEECGHSFLEAVYNAKKRFEQCDDKEIMKFQAKEIGILNKSFAEQYDMRSRADLNVKALNNWLDLYENGIELADYIGSEYKGSFGVYGFGVLGRRLCRVLNKNREMIRCVVDRNIDSVADSDKEMDNCVYVKRIDDMEPVDNVIISVSSNCDDIKSELIDKRKACNVITIMEILELLENNTENRRSYD